MKLTFFSFIQSFNKYWRPTKYKELVRNSLMIENLYITRPTPRKHKQSTKKVKPGTPTTTMQRKQ